MWSVSDNFQQLFLTVLLVSWAGLLFGGFFFGPLNPEGTRKMPTWTRMASSIVLTIAGWAWFAFTSGSYSLLIAIGMTLGLLGDLILAELFSMPQPVLGGIASFGFGHVVYITAIIQYGNDKGLDNPLPRWGALAVWLLIGLGGWYLVVFRGSKASVLHWAALPYALLLAGTAGFATGLALQSALFIPLAVGAALFLSSDLILAAQLFNNLKFKYVGDVVWLTYGPAQALIVFSVNSALLFSR